MERRAVFVTIPPLLSGMIAEAACAEISLKLVAEFSERGGLGERLSALAPDVVLIGLEAGETDDIGAFALELVPAATVVVISSDARHAYLHRKPVRRVVLRDLSLAKLLV